MLIVKSGKCIIYRRKVDFNKWEVKKVKPCRRICKTYWTMWRVVGDVKTRISSLWSLCNNN